MSEDYIQFFLTQKQATISEKSLTSYATILRQYWDFLTDNQISWSQANFLCLQIWLWDLAERGNIPSSLLWRLRIIQQFLKFLTKTGLYPRFMLSDILTIETTWLWQDNFCFPEQITQITKLSTDFNEILPTLAPIPHARLLSLLSLYTELPLSLNQILQLPCSALQVTDKYISVPNKSTIYHLSHPALKITHDHLTYSGNTYYLYEDSYKKRFSTIQIITGLQVMLKIQDKDFYQIAALLKRFKTMR